MIDEPVETQLRASRPAAPPVFAAQLEARLFGSANRVRRRLTRPRPVLAGAFAVIGIAAAVSALSLAGVGPLAARDQQDVKAGDQCHYVTVRQQRNVPHIVESAAGQPRLVYRSESVERRVKRCG